MPGGGYGQGLMASTLSGGGYLNDDEETIRGGGGPTMSVSIAVDNAVAYNSPLFTLTVTVTVTGTCTSLQVGLEYDDDSGFTVVPYDGTLNGWTRATGWSGPLESYSGSREATFTHPTLTNTTSSFTVLVQYSANTRVNGSMLIVSGGTGCIEVPVGTATITGTNPATWYHGFWEIDATSSKGVPASSASWSDFIAANGVPLSAPSNLWLMQESSGNLTDSIGGLTLTASGTVSYQNAIPGWTRKGLGTTNGTAGKWGVASGSGPNPSTTSVAVLLYVRIDNATAERGVLCFDDTTNDFVTVNVTAAGLLRGYIDTAGTSSVGNYEGVATFPLLYVYDRTNSRARLYTSTEKVSPTYASVSADGAKFFGHTTVPATSMYLYGCWWTGANAEWLSTDANAKEFLQDLGWTVSGY